MSTEAATVWILGDQLLPQHPAVTAAVEAGGRYRVLLIESASHLQRRPYQRKKLVLLLSAMRHYAKALRQQGMSVDYIQADDFVTGLRQHLQRRRPDRLLTMAASSYWGRQAQERLPARLGIPVQVLPNTQFLTGIYNPIPDPQPDKRYVMEHFYREMRRHFNLLMDGDEPAGGRWNFDQENRRRLPADNQPPLLPEFEPDQVTRQVMTQVASLPHGLGQVDGFAYAVSREQALLSLQDFLERRLPQFGDYEDALSSRSHALYHSLLSPYLNLGLLQPLELVRAAETVYRAGRAPLNAVEGFVRQIIGWREFMYWQYWRQMPGLLGQNAWNARRPLPRFVWDGQTDMACLRHALRRALDTGYNHHIERLMLLCNFFMLSGIEPAAANNWFMAMYIDAAEWVMPPNVLGMGLNADGGLTATKPYIASANYINNMGDLCAQCRYNPRKRHGPEACPFNPLYWNFVLAHEERLRANPRTARNTWGLRHLDETERELVRRQAADFLDGLDTGTEMG